MHYICFSKLQSIITGLEPMDTATPPNPSPPEQMVVIPETRNAEDVLMMDREERSVSFICDTVSAVFWFGA